MSNIQFNFKNYEEKQEGLVIYGVATANCWDRDGQKILISPKALKNALPVFYQNESPAKIGHGRTVKFGDNAVGKVLLMTYEPQDFVLDVDKANYRELEQMKVFATVLITDKQAIEEIKNGFKTKYNGFSLGWISKNFWSANGDENIRIDTEIEILELSVVEVPSNPEAENFQIITDNKDLKNIFKLGDRVETESIPAVGIVKKVYQKDDKYFYDVDFANTNFKSQDKIPENLLKNFKEFTTKKTIMANSNDIITLLTQLVATSYDLSIKLHGFHWNLEGQDFQQFHYFFDDLRWQNMRLADLCAEKLRTLDVFAPQGIASMVENSILEPTALTTEIPEMLTISYNDFCKLHDLLGLAQSQAGLENKVDIQNFLVEKMSDVADIKWKLKSSTENTQNIVAIVTSMKSKNAKKDSVKPQIKLEFKFKKKS